MHQLNTKSPDLGNFSHLFSDLVNHPEKFYNYFRMTNENFKNLEVLQRVVNEFYYVCAVAVS